MRRRPVLIVFVKEVVAGRVKTRLGVDIGMTRAAWWQRHQTARLLRRLRDRRWSIVLAVTPDRALTSAAWPGDFLRIPQGRGDLGTRMARAIRAMGPGPALLVGSDIPGLSCREVAGAFAALGPERTVLGPAPDGGFWGIGFRNAALARSGHFAGVRWSTTDALADTRARLPGPVAIAAELADVDSAADLARREIPG